MSDEGKQHTLYRFRGSLYVEWLHSTVFNTFKRVGWHRMSQALPWWFMRLQAGGMVVSSTLVEGWMVQEEADSSLVVHEVLGRWNGCTQYLG